MTTAQALTRAKHRLGIEDSNTDFDTRLTEFFETSVNRLAPKVMAEVADQTASVSPDDYGEATVDLSALGTPLDDVRKVEGRQSGRWWPVDRFYRHGTELQVRELPSDTTEVRIYGLEEYVVSSSTVALDRIWELPVIWFMMAEFFDYLASDKSAYNIYSEQSGARAVDNMQDESLYYEQKAEAYLEDRAQRYGK